MDEWSSCIERHVRITLAPTEFGNHYVCTGPSFVDVGLVVCSIELMTGRCLYEQKEVFHVGYNLRCWTILGTQYSYALDVAPVTARTGVT